MKRSYPVPGNEKARLEALRSYELLDTRPERAFDDITRLASFICGTPIAVMTLVDGERQWFKARVGLEAVETPREHAFCAHTIMGPDLMIVEDAREDARFADNPSVVGEPHVRFYAGAPLISSSGYGLGSLCVVDRQPRKLSLEQYEALTALARMVVTEMELRRVSAQLADTIANVKVLSGLLPICSYCKGIRNDQGYWQQLEQYVSEHSQADFSHSICPRCFEKHFPGFQFCGT